MGRVEVAHEIPVPRTEAWDYITSPDNWLDYWPGLASIGEVPEGWPSSGQSIDLVMHVVGSDRPVHLDLDTVMPYRMLAYRSRQKGLADGTFELHFADTGTGTKYRICIAFEPRRGLLGVLDRLVVAPVIQRDLRRTMHNLDKVFARRGQRAEPSLD